MRIAQLANFVGPSSGGMKTAVEQLGAGYVEAGVTRLLVIPGPQDETRETSAGRVVQLRAPRVGGGYRLILEPWRAAEVLASFAPTSLEISDKSTLVPVSHWARRNGVPTILFSHERLDAMLALRTGWGLTRSVSVFNRMLVRQFDAVVVTSSFAAREFRVVAEAAGTLLHEIPLGVDLEAFHPGQPGRRRSQRPLRLVHVGRLSREKRPHLAVATAMALHRRGVDVRLDVYGEGPHRPELERMAAGAPVTFHGHVGDRQVLAEHLREADIALSVCPGETFGLAVLEALACGTPVVTASVGGARELVNLQCASWAPARPELLADAVLALAKRLTPITRTAARTQAERYPWASAVGSMLALHRALGGDQTRQLEERASA